MFEWRIAIIRRLMRVLVLLSAPVVLASSYSAAVQGETYLIPIYLAFVAGLVVITYWRKVTDQARMVSLMVLLYLLVLLDYATEGRGSLAPVYLMALAFSGALFFGMRGTLTALGLGVATMTLFAALYSSGMLPNYAVTSNRLASWVSNGALVVLFISFIGLSLSFVIEKMTTLIQQISHEAASRENRLRMLRIIIPAGVALTAEKDFNRLLETIVIEAQKLCNADGGSVYLARENELEFLIARNDMLKIAFGGTTGVKPSFPPLPTHDADGNPNLKSAAVRVALSGERLIVNDVYGDLPEGLDLSMTKKFDQEHDYYTQSLLVLPLIDTAGQVLGVLQLINARNARGELIVFRPDDVLESLVLLGATALTSYWREEKLRAEIAKLRIEIDQVLKAKHVTEVTETEYFKQLQLKAIELRNTRK